MDRPLPSGRLNGLEATVFAIGLTLVGFYILFVYINPLTAYLTFASLVLYAFAYTPMKKASSAAVFVGAIPGALPPLIGWVAATGVIEVEALVLFAIQFVWQFPHFWAIAWILDEDYKRAGIKLLPSKGGKDFSTAFQIMGYTMCLIPLGILPAKLGIAGPISAIVCSLVGLVFLILTVFLLKDGSTKSAKRIMFFSFIYLPIVLLTILFDKL